MNLIRFRSTVPTFNPRSLLDELDRLFETGLPEFNRRPNFGAFPVDIYQDGDAVNVLAELPGFRKEDLRVKVAATYENGVLTVTLPKWDEVKPKTVAIEVK